MEKLYKLLYFLWNTLNSLWFNELLILKELLKGTKIDELVIPINVLHVFTKYLRGDIIKKKKLTII